MQQFGYAAQYVPTESIRDIFREVERGRADFGVVPIENSTEGVVNYTLDMFIDSDLKIYAEIMLEVSQNLMNKSGRIEDIKKIYTHPQVPGQCRLWLEKNLPGIPIMDAPSTARAAEMASQDPSIGAIASEMASMLYGLQMVARRIEDNQNNFTRFLVIAPKSPGKTGPRQDLHHVLDQGPRRRALRHARALCRKGHQPEPSRCPAFGQEGLGLCFLPRYGRPHRGREGRRGDRTAAGWTACS